MEKGGNSGNIGARKPILALGELLVDLVPGREGMRIEDAGPVVKTASGSAGIFACAATLLGGRGGFIGKVGRDSLSRMVAGTLRGQGVDLSRLIVSDEGQMGLALSLIHIYVKRYQALKAPKDFPCFWSLCLT